MLLPFRCRFCHGVAFATRYAAAAAASSAGSAPAIFAVAEALTGACSNVLPACWFSEERCLPCFFRHGVCAPSSRQFSRRRCQFSFAGQLLPAIHPSHPEATGFASRFFAARASFIVLLRHYCQLAFLWRSLRFSSVPRPLAPVFTGDDARHAAGFRRRFAFSWFAATRFRQVCVLQRQETQRPLFSALFRCWP